MSEKLSLESKEKLFGDMSSEDFRKYGHQIIDWISNYLSNIENYPVLSQVQYGDIKKQLPKSAPTSGENMEKILQDFEKNIMPGITHWNHPNFFAYFANTGSIPGIFGELLASALNVQGMLWKTSPSCTELEEVTLDWLRQMLGLPTNYFGIIYDYATISTLHAICAAREALNLKIREEGMAGRKELLPLKLYVSEQAHSSIEKAAIVLGIGQNSVRKIFVDRAFQMDTKALVNVIEEDIKSGCIPFCVVATVGTTSTTSMDPTPLIADICKKYNLWLHIDAAYGGIAAIVPEMKYITDGWNQADSIVVNPHKWLFTPIDLSAFYCRKPEILKRALSLVPEYLKTGQGDEVLNYMDYGVHLGRRFRALKLWMIMNYFGQDGLVNRIREHIRLARLFTKLIDTDPDFQCLAPVPFSTVCYRFHPKDLKERYDKRDGETKFESYLNELNEDIMNSVNATGKIYISHTKLHGRFTLRFAIGNIRTTEQHVKEAFKLIREHGLKLDGERRIRN